MRPSDVPGTRGRALLARLLLRSLLAIEPGSRAARLAAPVYRLLRAPLVRAGDPPLRYTLDGAVITVPLSHDLPVVRQMSPAYGRNLTAVAGTVASKYPEMTAIDIGANVGDSAVLMRNGADFPILCIEGDEAYMRILRSNLESFQGIEAERGFVAAETTVLARALERGRGTARLASAGGRSIEMRSLADILRRHPKFTDAKLVKIDTDGMDIEILLGARSLIVEAEPILFFEYDPTLAGATEARCFEVFELLRSSGYGEILAFDNLGEYLVSAKPSDERLLADLHKFASQPKRYLDLCATPADDTDIAERIRAASGG